MDVESAAAAAKGSQRQEGLVVHGLFLEGCGWDADARQLCESAPKVREYLAVYGAAHASSTPGHCLWCCAS